MTQENQQGSNAPAPNPSGVPQTPPQGVSDPQSAANPQNIERSGPAASAGPQSVMFSSNHSNDRNREDG